MRIDVPRAWRLRLSATALVAASLAVAVGAMAAAGDEAAPAGAAAPGGTTPPAPAKPPAATVRIVFTVIPSSKKATVSWGKKKLGVIAPHAPLIVQRPRDSGPLDVVVRADGCVAVQTRAYTFEDSKVAVHVTPNDQKNTLLGYREEQPAADGGVAAGNPDGGAR
jgi:hypothetical protein